MFVVRRGLFVWCLLFAVWGGVICFGFLFWGGFLGLWVLGPFFGLFFFFLFLFKQQRLKQPDLVGCAEEVAPVVGPVSWFFLCPAKLRDVLGGERVDGRGSGCAPHLHPSASERSQGRWIPRCFWATFESVNGEPGNRFPNLRTSLFLARLQD